VGPYLWKGEGTARIARTAPGVKASSLMKIEELSAQEEIPEKEGPGRPRTNSV